MVRAGLFTSVIACMLTTPRLWYFVSSLVSAALASSLLKRQDSLRRACIQNSIDERRAHSVAEVTYGSSCGVSKRFAIGTVPGG